MNTAKYNIELTSTAMEDLRALRAVDQAKIEDAIETYLRYEPDKVSKSRTKRLRGLISPQYRLRVDEHRLFYDIEYRIEPKSNRVIILAIKHKSDVNQWLKEGGTSDETGTIE
jgi:mRNA interferase RelE/StbE